MWVVQAVALTLLTLILPGLEIQSFLAAAAAVGIIALLNAVLWPILSYVLLPLAVLTLGLLALVLNGALIWFTGQLVDGFSVDGLWTAMLAALVLSAVNSIASALLTIDDDSPWFRNVVRRAAKRIAEPEETDVPGVFFLEIDGLAKPVLEQAMAAGRVPTLQRWLESGTHRLIGWETDLSSQTSASQAGILHGNNKNIPAFRWYDRERKQLVSSSTPDDVANIEQLHSDGNGLLANGGASRGNLFSGDAPIVMNTASTIKDLKRFHTLDFYAFFAAPYNFTRTLLLAGWDIILEKYRFWQDRRKGVVPILGKEKRGGMYPLMRAFTTIIMRELNIETMVGDMFAGTPAAYATFVGYDEVAHHSGVDSEDAFDILQKLDLQFGRLERAAEGAPRPYHFVVLSDHGQSGGSTFKQRYHLTLEQLVHQLAKETLVEAGPDVHEDWKHLNVFLTEAVQSERDVVARPLGRVLKNRTEDGEVGLGPEAEATWDLGDRAGTKLTEGTELRTQPEEGAAPGGEDGNDSEEDSDRIVVLASGNLGLVYGKRRDERATMEEIDAFYPGLLDGLANHEGVGFVMVHSLERGGVVIGAEGHYYLDTDRVEGQNPLADFGPRAAEHLRRTDSFRNAPDILVNSFYRADTNEVAAYEELIGSHGGLGGYQTQPFLLVPAEWSVEEEELVGAEAVYRQFKRWLAEVQPSQEPAEAATGA
jgi:putative membrane protein